MTNGGAPSPSSRIRSALWALRWLIGLIRVSRFMWIIRAEFGQNIGQIGAFFKYLRALRQSPPFRTFSGSTRFFSKGKRHYRCANTVQAPIADIEAFHGASPERRIQPLLSSEERRVGKGGV